MKDFANAFAALTGHSGPLPWQARMYHEWVARGEFPASCSLPTGLGKTSVVAVWLIALANGVNVPRRLVYVVNRRTVVDQTTNELRGYRDNVQALPDDNRLKQVVDQLGVSTLRGQLADNHEWSADPSKPAIIIGTVDMIGSRLLFNGYRIGFKSRPLHAGFLGQDVILIHDEAHLEPAFQRLIETIKQEQKKERKVTDDLPWPGLHVMEMSATTRNNDNAGVGTFALTVDDREQSIVKKRLGAPKKLRLYPCADEKNQLVTDVVKFALKHKESGLAILVYLRSVEHAQAASNHLDKALPGHVVPLTGTMRGYERDQLIRSNSVFARFMPKGDRPSGLVPANGTVYLVCTSAGEVGVNLSADHMVCDLSTFDSMAQRLGRVNRFGERTDTRVDVVHPNPDEFDAQHPLSTARKATLELLKRLGGSAHPGALSGLPADQCLSAFAPEPSIPPATDILFDAWAMTTIRDTMPGRPPVGPYLHGVSAWELPRTSIAWREEVEMVSGELIEREGEQFPQDLLADFPLKPQEMLSDPTERVYDALNKLIAEPRKSVKGDKRRAALERAHKNGATPVWLIDDTGTVRVTPLDDLLSEDKKRVIERLADATILLPPCIGGLTTKGLLDGEMGHDPGHPQGYDVADRGSDEEHRAWRHREFSENPRPTRGPDGMALLRTIDTDPLADERAAPDEGSEPTSTTKRFWHWYARPRDAENPTLGSSKPITWEHHTRDVVQEVRKIIGNLNWAQQFRKLQDAIVLAAELHDLGKKRELWQRSIGNPNPDQWYAKPGKPDVGPRWRPRRLSGYRHEFGSLLDVLEAGSPHARRLASLDDEMCDVVLHLIAAHHGYARPHFPSSATIDPHHPSSDADHVSIEVMRRYARLQRRYGRWGLAYLESLLRAADWAASAEPSEIEGEA